MGRKRYARKRKSRKKRSMSAGAKLMAQQSNNGMSRTFKFTDTFPLVTSNVPAGNNPVALVNFLCINNGVGVGPTSFYTIVGPNNC